MKSMKGGRGPSIIRAVALFGIAVLAMVALGQSGTPGSVAYAGVKYERTSLLLVIFILMAVCGGIWFLYRAFAQNRPSETDAAGGDEEPDPLNEYPQGKDDAESTEEAAAAGSRYCPNCGRAVQEDANFCSHCGKELK